MTEEEKQKLGWETQFTEDWMIGMNMITPELLQKIRLILMVAYPIKGLEVTCDFTNFKMQFDCKFKFWRSLFRKKMIMSDIHNKLTEKFKNYEITINRI